MHDFGLFLGAMLDCAHAALIGLNLVPLLVVSLFIGMAQSTRNAPLIKSAIAIIPGAVVMALWPLTLGYSPIWPDLRQPEAQFQVIMLLALAYAVIFGLGLIKTALCLPAPVRVH